MKPCHTCGKVRPLDEFPRRRASRDGRRGTCAECTRAHARDRYRGARDTARARRYLRRYGITADQVDRMRQDQAYRCAMCGRHEDQLPQGLVVDHCHLTDVVRGLLCTWCNSGLGHLQESPEVLAAGIAYLIRALELLSIAETERT